MAGYSGRPLAQKLGIGPGRAVALVGAPEGFERKLGTLPAGVAVRRDAGAALERRFPSAARMLNERGGVWIEICAIDGVWSGLLFARRRG